MFKIFNRFFYSIKGARLWINALDEIAKGKYSEGKATLEEYASIDSNSSKNPEFFLLISLIEYRKSNYTDSISAIQEARKLIRLNNKYTSDDKNYLFCYSDRLLKQLIGSEFSQSECLGVFSDIKLEKVSKSLQLNFPLW